MTHLLSARRDMIYWTFIPHNTHLLRPMLQCRIQMRFSFPIDWRKLELVTNSVYRTAFERTVCSTEIDTTTNEEARQLGRHFFSPCVCLNWACNISGRIYRHLSIMHSGHKYKCSSYNYYGWFGCNFVHFKSKLITQYESKCVSHLWTSSPVYRAIVHSRLFTYRLISLPLIACSLHYHIWQPNYLYCFCELFFFRRSTGDKSTSEQCGFMWLIVAALRHQCSKCHLLISKDARTS